MTYLHQLRSCHVAILTFLVFSSVKSGFEIYSSLTFWITSAGVYSASWFYNRCTNSSGLAIRPCIECQSDISSCRRVHAHWTINLVGWGGLERDLSSLIAYLSIDVLIAFYAFSKWDIAAARSALASSS